MEAGDELLLVSSPDAEPGLRQMLAGEAPVIVDDATAMGVDLPAWRWTDVLVVLVACLGFCGAVWL